MHVAQEVDIACRTIKSPVFNEEMLEDVFHFLFLPDQSQLETKHITFNTMLTVIIIYQKQVLTLMYLCRCDLICSIIVRTASDVGLSNTGNVVCSMLICTADGTPNTC